MKKTKLLISGAREASETMLIIMAENDKLRIKREEFRTKALNAVRYVQYQTNMYQYQVTDNKIAKNDQALYLLSEHLPLPQ